MHIHPIKPFEVFQALSDETRLRIIHLMVETGEEACLCELVDSLLEPTYKLSRHVKILRQAGLLTSEKEGRWIYHRLMQKPQYLEVLYDTVRALPDHGQIYNADLKRFRQRLRLREDGRCQTGHQFEESKTEAK